MAGLFLGLSFLFRYQNAFLALGIFLWLLVIEREKILDLLKLLAAGVVVLLLGILMDFWLYGEFTLSAWNYFYVNVVEDVASGYGTEAWWTAAAGRHNAPGWPSARAFPSRPSQFRVDRDPPMQCL